MLEKSRDSALRTRNRTLAWRKQRIAIATADAFHRSLLLAWRAYALGKRHCAVRALHASAIAKQAQLQAVETQLHAKLSNTQSFLRALRSDVMQFPERLARFRDDVCSQELPQVRPSVFDRLSSTCVNRELRHSDDGLGSLRTIDPLDAHERSSWRSST